MTQKDLAGRTGISEKLISAYENNRVQPRKGNRLLLLDALDGTWPEESGATPTGGTKPTGVVRRCASYGDAAGLATSGGAQIVVAWIGEKDLDANAAAFDDRVLTIRACVVPAALDDLDALRACIDRLAEQIRGSTP